MTSGTAIQIESWSASHSQLRPCPSGTAVRGLDGVHPIRLWRGAARNPFKNNWHIAAITHKLSQVAEGDVKRLIITLPPRSLKSLAASVALPARFLWTQSLGTRGGDLVFGFLGAHPMPNDFRRVVTDPLYRATFPAMRLARDTDREIISTLRGKRIATSLEGTLTGLGGNLIIIDDPIKLGDAMSEAVRARGIELVSLDPAVTRGRQDNDAHCAGDAAGASGRSRRLSAGAGGI